MLFQRGRNYGRVRRGQDMSRLPASALLLCLLSFAIPGNAQRGRDWAYLGEANVDDRADHDKIDVSERGAFRAIQLRVERGPIEFDRMLVHCRNGASIPVAIRRRIPARGETRVIDLPGNRRIIESVEL
jgi:hypothetical protein